MTRTPESRDRRRRLADAATGFPERTRVALYACLPESASPEPVTAKLREYAAARDFVVPEDGVVIDRGLVGTVRRERPGWSKVSALLREHAIEGIVVPAIAHIEAEQGRQAELVAWLTTHGTFVCCLGESDALTADDAWVGA
ncbi:recombinase family protein [Streptomyces sp. NPDC101490]|uniref:recombinase family protein n=1 Tax=Streptomyces sp. NPDC101490 TaxID=3366143 RepID=UPI003815E9A1